MRPPTGNPSPNSWSLYSNSPNVLTLSKLHNAGFCQTYFTPSKPISSYNHFLSFFKSKFDCCDLVVLNFQFLCVFETRHYLNYLFILVVFELTSIQKKDENKVTRLLLMDYLLHYVAITAEMWIHCKPANLGSLICVEYQWS